MQTRSPILGRLFLTCMKTTYGIRNIILMFCQTQPGPTTSLCTARTTYTYHDRMRNENSSYPTADRTPTHAHTQRLWGQIFQRCTQQQCQHSRLYIPCVIIAPKCEQDSLPYLVLLKWSTWHSQQKHPQQQGRVSFMEYSCLMFL